MNFLLIVQIGVLHLKKTVSMDPGAKASQSWQDNILWLRKANYYKTFPTQN